MEIVFAAGGTDVGSGRSGRKAMIIAVSNGVREWEQRQEGSVTTASADGVATDTWQSCRWWWLSCAVGKAVLFIQPVSVRLFEGHGSLLKSAATSAGCSVGKILIRVALRRVGAQTTALREQRFLGQTAAGKAE